MALSLCQLAGNSFLRQVRGVNVLKCIPSSSMLSPAALKIEAEEKKAASGRQKGKKSPENEKPTQYYDVLLSETCMFPEGGGQPWDTGYIKTGDEEVPVVNCYRDSIDGSIIHKTTIPVEIGKEVTVEVDFVRRFDLMQQHSAQHLISAVFKNTFKAKTISWYMTREDKGEECYIDLDSKDLTFDDVIAAELEVNELIRKALPIKVHIFKTQEEAEKHEPYQNALKDGKAKPLPSYDSLLTPARVIETESVEFNTCCGTHLESTSQIQLVALPRLDKVKGSNRVYFFAGDRARAAICRMVKLQQQITKVLSCPSEEFVPTIEKLQKDSRASHKANTKLLAEVAQNSAVELVNAVSGSPVVHLHRGDCNDTAFIAAVSDAFVKLAPQVLLFLTSTSEELGGSAQEGMFQLVGPDALVAKCGPLVATAMEGRGGGRKGMYQGKAARVDKRADALNAVKKALAFPE